MNDVLSKMMLTAAQAAYTKKDNEEREQIVHALPAGYRLDTRFNTTGYVADPDTGTKVIALINDNTREVILAFTGTEDAQDWFQNLKLGWDQWDNAKADDPKAKVLTYLAQAQVEGAAKIHFTGHSLGGALAQYAAYDYIEQFKNNATNLATAKARITLTTFNALGGVQGLAQYRDGFNAALFAGVYNRHYWVDGDPSTRRHPSVAAVKAGARTHRRVPACAEVTTVRCRRTVYNFRPIELAPRTR